MAKQSFEAMMAIVNEFHKECDTKKEIEAVAPSMMKRTSPITQKYFNRLLFAAAQRGEAWAA